MHYRVRLFGFVLAALTYAAAAFGQRATESEFAKNVLKGKRPRLTVVISIDQFRADYLRRLNDLFLPPIQNGKPGGFRYLMTQGAYFMDARYEHFPTFTGPGHAVILTGAHPYTSGIVANEWWDRQQGKIIYCVDEPMQKVVGAVAGSQAKPMGSKNLRATTVGDELKMATAGAAKVITLGLKDRAAILLGGHLQDLSLWFDEYTGRWISSTAYCKSGKLPEWAEQVNAQGIPDKALGTTWTPTLPAETLQRTTSYPISGDRIPYNMGSRFPHPIGAEKTRANYRAFTLTPGGNAFVFTTAKSAVLAEKLGMRGETPDLLAINLSTNDYVGHAFGPFSPEAMEITVATDRQIADFLQFLQQTIPGGLKEVLFVVTADHGVAPIVERLAEEGVTAGRVLDGAIEAAAQKALVEAFGADNWIGKADGYDKKAGAYVEPYLYLGEAAVQNALRTGKAKSRAQIEEVAGEAVAALPGVYACYTRTQIKNGALPKNEITRRVVNGFYPKVSGDVVVVTEQLHLTDPGTGGPYITSHGTPYAYDIQVPILLAGPGVRPGVRAERVSPIDIAPTLCAILGLQLPSGCDGVALTSALK